MLAAQSPSSNTQIQRPKSNRKPLQPKNTPITPQINSNTKPKLNRDWFEISLISDSNKENLHPSINGIASEKPKIEIESFDSSLAEELNAIREKLERLKADKENTDKMLKQRDLMLDLQLKQLETRGEVQKQLEIEVDRLYRLKELRLSCMRISPIRSLREKEQERKIKGDEAKEINIEETSDMRDENTSLSSNSDIDEDSLEVERIENS